MYRKAPLLVLAVAAGVLVGALGASIRPGNGLWSDDSAEVPSTSAVKPVRPDPSAAPDLDHLADVIESLTQVLNDEINERRVVSEQLEELRSEMTDLKQNLRARVEEAFQMESAAGQESGNTVTQDTLEDRYAAAGISRRHLESIRGLQADSQMARIELDDRARREGWFNTPRYFQEAQALASDATAVRSMLGDDLYDRYLFASGTPNRLMVGSVIESSPAQEAGFRQGDVIVRYAGERVFTSEQINDLRSSGVRGEPVTVEILRDGRPLRLTIPRGPMGISGAATVADPDAVRD